MSLLGDIGGAVFGTNMMGLSSAGAIAGDLLAYEAAEDAEDGANERNRQNIEMQREFAKNGIQWKVEDAKAAGLHPLYAIGAQGAAFTPNPTSIDDGRAAALSRMGQNVSRAIQAQETAFQRENRYLQNRLIEAQIKKTHAESLALESDAARSRQSARFAAPMASAMGVDAIGREQGPYGGAITYKPDEVTSRSWADPAFTAGKHPGWSQREVGGGSFLTVFPQESISEMFENPVTALWALNKTLKEDPEFFKKDNSFPFGRTIWDFSEGLWNFLNRGYSSSSKERERDREEHDREMYLLRDRARRQGKPRFIPYNQR